MDKTLITLASPDDIHIRLTEASPFNYFNELYSQLAHIGYSKRQLYPLGVITAIGIQIDTFLKAGDYPPAMSKILVGMIPDFITCVVQDKTEAEMIICQYERMVDEVKK